MASSLLIADGDHVIIKCLYCGSTDGHSRMLLGEIGRVIGQCHACSKVMDLGPLTAFPPMGKGLKTLNGDVWRWAKDGWEREEPAEKPISVAEAEQLKGDVWEYVSSGTYFCDSCSAFSRLSKWQRGGTAVTQCLSCGHKEKIT